MIFHFVCLSISFSIPSVFICCLFHITVNASLVEPNYGNDNDANDNEESSYSPVANTNDGTHLGIKRHRKKDHNHNKLTKSSKKKNKHKQIQKHVIKVKAKRKINIAMSDQIWRTIQYVFIPSSLDICFTLLLYLFCRDRYDGNQK